MEEEEEEEEEKETQRTLNACLRLCSWVHAVAMLVPGVPLEHNSLWVTKRCHGRQRYGCSYSEHEGEEEEDDEEVAMFL